MHCAEVLNILFFSCMAVFAWLLPLPVRRRIRAGVIGAAGSAACVFASLSDAILPEQTSRVFRDWLPVPLMLVAYHQGGQLFTKPWNKFQTMLMNLDRKVLGPLAESPEKARLNPFLSSYLEITYAACYPLIPAALGTLYRLDLQDHVEGFWAVVLLPTYLCYALVPILPSLPPRFIHAESGVRDWPGKARAFNLWTLRHWSIQANTFPSAHVTACIASSLVLLRHDLPVGTGFLWIALSIAAGAVVRRYHYLADAVLGVVLPLVPFLLLR